MAVVACACGLNLPETLHQKLPETLGDAQKFGQDQGFWYVPEKTLKTPIGDQTPTEEEEKLNKIQYE